MLFSIYIVLFFLCGLLLPFFCSPAPSAEGQVEQENPETKKEEPAAAIELEEDYLGLKIVKEETADF